MSIYVPIVDDQSQEILALFEIYKYPQFLYELIRRGRLVLWAVVVIAGGVLFVGQFGLVLAASRTINRQYDDLKQHADRLENVNRQLRDTQAQLVEAERFAALGEVTAAVAHGIRNPLGNIRLVSQETRESLDQANPLRAPLAEIMQQVDLLEERLRNFLNTSKPCDLTLAPIQLSAVVQAAIEALRPRLSEKGIELVVKSLDGDCSVQGDAVKLEEVLRILISNSIEAGARKITIGDCRLLEDAGRRRIAFHVIDDGAGFPPGAVERLFEPFYTTKPLGTGLGLVIAKKMIEAHGGALMLAPHTPNGVDARIELPLLQNRREGNRS
jgi:signal transduction histidine kinase